MVPLLCRAAFRFALASVRFAFTSCVVCASVSRPGLCVCVYWLEGGGYNKVRAPTQPTCKPRVGIVCVI